MKVKRMAKLSSNIEVMNGKGRRISRQGSHRSRKSMQKRSFLNNKHKLPIDNLLDVLEAERHHLGSSTTIRTKGEFNE